jgi:hypothetical protein
VTTLLPLNYLKVEHNYTGTSWQDFTGDLASLQVNLREFTGQHTAALSFYRVNMDPSQTTATTVIKKGDKVRIHAKNASGTLRKMATMLVKNVTVDIDLTKPSGRRNRVKVHLVGIGVAGVAGTGASKGVATNAELSDVVTGAPYEINGNGLGRVYAWTGTGDNSTSTETALDATVRTNLVKDTGFEYASSTTGGWVQNAGGTITKDTTNVWERTKALKVVATVDNWGYFPMDGSTNGGSTTPTHTSGTTYTASVWVYASTAQNLRLINYGSTATNGATVAVAANTWTRLSVTFVAGTTVFLSVRNPAATAIGTAWLDGFMVEQSSTLDDYFSGATPNPTTTPIGTSVEVASINTASEFDQIALTRDSQPGTVVYEDPSGKMQIYDPGGSWGSGRTKLTIGPNWYSAIDQQFDMSHIINVLTFKYFEKIKTGAKHTRMVEHDTTYTDSASKAKYGPFKKTIKSHKKSDFAAHASSIFARNADPVNVPASVTIPIRTASDLLGGYEDGHYVGEKVNIVLPDGVTTYACRVARIQHNISPTQWTVQVFVRQQDLIQRPRHHSDVTSEVANTPDKMVLSAHLEDTIDATGKSINNGTIATKTSGNRIQMRDDGSEGIIEFFTGVAGETNGQINPQVDGSGIHYIDIITSHPTSRTSGKMRLSASSAIANPLLQLLNNTDLSVAGSLNVNSGYSIAGGGSINGALSNNAGITITGTNNSLTVSSPPTTASAANVFIGSGGLIQKVTSLRKAKVEIEPLSDAAVRGVLGLTPVSFYDRGEVEDNGGSTEGLRRIPGLIAEDVEEHAPELALYDAEGDLQGVAYDRVAALLIPIIREQQQTIHDLTQRIGALERAALKGEQ